jgi:hypothetical protein
METTLNERRIAEELRRRQMETERKSKEVAERTNRMTKSVKRLRNANPVTTIFLAASHRKAIKEGDFSVFFFAFALALVQDGFIDLIAAIPIIGALIVAVPSAIITCYLFVFLWGRGTLKLKIIRSILLLLNIFPVIGMLPFQTFCVWWAYRDAKKEAEIAKEAEKKAAEEMERDDYMWA